MDVASDESVEKAKKLLEEKTKQYGGLHGVVNNAGIVGSAFVDDFLTVNDYKKVVPQCPPILKDIDSRSERVGNSSSDPRFEGSREEDQGTDCSGYLHLLEGCHPRQRALHRVEVCRVWIL